MEKSRPPILVGYDLAIARMQELHQARTGKRHGARTWLAERLGISRQSLDNWKDRCGFPTEYVSRVAKLTGLPADMIRPRTVIVELPELDWAEAPKSLKDQATIHSSKRRKYG